MGIRTAIRKDEWKAKVIKRTSGSRPGSKSVIPANQEAEVVQSQIQVSSLPEVWIKGSIFFVKLFTVFKFE